MTSFATEPKWAFGLPLLSPVLFLSSKPGRIKEEKIVVFTLGHTYSGLHINFTLSFKPLLTLPLAEAVWVFLGARNRPNRNRAGTPLFLSLLAPPKKEPAELSGVGRGWEGN